MSKKVALVTGGGRGIGFGIAAALLKAGYCVVIGEKDKALCQSALAKLSSLGDADALIVDVAREAKVQELVAHTITKFSRLNLLVNNAAIANPYQPPITELSLEEWQERLSVNLGSVFLCCKYSLPHLKTSRGSIINISSTRALMSEPHSEAYAASKGAMDALTHALAISYGPEVRVNAIRPGWIDTRPKQQEEPLPARAHAQHPVGRVGEPEDIADLVLYLARATFVTGQAFTVDGGMTRKMIYDAADW